MPKLETIAVIYDLPDAVCMKSALDSLGIPVFVDGYCHASVDWWVSVAIAGMRIRVVDTDAALARDYLRLFDAEHGREPRVSTDVWRKPVVNAFLLLFGLILAEPIWYRKPPRKAG